MSLTRSIVTITLSLIGLFLFTTVVNAAGCITIFGGGNTCQNTSKTFTLTKQVKNPQTGSFVSSLSASGPYYAPNQTITFRVTIENKTSNKFSNVVITDTFPRYFTYLSGNGKYDDKKKTLTTTIDTLNANEKKSYDITGKVASANDLSNLSGQTNCFINQITSSIRGSSDDTNSQYCVQKTVSQLQAQTQPAPVSQPVSPTPKPKVPSQTTNGKIVYAPPATSAVPPTGPETWSLLALIPAGFLGLFLRRKPTFSS